MVQTREKVRRERRAMKKSMMTDQRDGMLVVYRVSVVDGEGEYDMRVRG